MSNSHQFLVPDSPVLSLDTGNLRVQPCPKGRIPAFDTIKVRVPMHHAELAAQALSSTLLKTGSAGPESSPASASMAPLLAGDRSASSPPFSQPNMQPSKRRRLQAQQKFECFVVYDFEATCQRLPNQIKPQEIIEFSCVILDAVTLEVGDQFQEYVRPTEHRLLTNFCVELTGITQDRCAACSLTTQFYCCASASCLSWVKPACW